MSLFSPSVQDDTPRFTKRLRRNGLVDDRSRRPRSVHLFRRRERRGDSSVTECTEPRLSRAEWPRTTSARASPCRRSSPRYQSPSYLELRHIAAVDLGERRVASASGVSAGIRPVLSKDRNTGDQKKGDSPEKKSHLRTPSSLLVVPLSGFSEGAAVPGRAVL